MTNDALLTISGMIAILAAIIGGNRLKTNWFTLEPFPKWARATLGVVGIVMVAISVTFLFRQDGLNQNFQATQVAFENTKVAFEGLPTHTPQVQIVTVTQSLPTPFPNILLFDDFSAIRNDGLGIEARKEISLTTEISGGHYVVETRNPGVITRFTISTKDKARNFDLDLQIAEIQEAPYLKLYFRRLPNGTGASITFYTDSGKYFVDVYNAEESRLANSQVNYIKLKNLRITCMDARCFFYVNDNDDPFEEIANVLDNSGSFEIGFFGNGILRIDSITIKELK